MANSMDPIRTNSKAPAGPFYNSSPSSLLWYDLKLFFAFSNYILGTISPLTPTLSGPLDELYPSRANLWCISIHLLLTIVQLGFLLSLFLCVFPTLLFVIVYVSAFLMLNYVTCMITLNGHARFIRSNVDLHQFPRHDNEKWMFINGVSVGHHWLQSSVNLLAKTFGREVLGIHNLTHGILFDLIQCVMERDFLYYTRPTRDGYVLIQRALKDPRYDKVVLILHSEGGIQGGLIVDMLIADLSENHMHKLEVYTFAAAANHFNNPARIRDETKQNLIRHIEHYANSHDFVSRWGVVNFAKAPTHLTNHFVGKLFERRGSGHMLNQHYLDTMFPLDPHTGQVAESNEFMEMLVDAGAIEGKQNKPAMDAKLAMALGHDTPHTPGSLVAGNLKPVKELSRLWKYRNGLSPQDE